GCAARGGPGGGGRGPVPPPTAGQAVRGVPHGRRPWPAGCCGSGGRGRPVRVLPKAAGSAPPPAGPRGCADRGRPLYPAHPAVSQGRVAGLTVRAGSRSILSPRISSIRDITSGERITPEARTLS